MCCTASGEVGTEEAERFAALVGEVGNGTGAADGTSTDVAPIGAAGGLSGETPVALAGCREANDAAAASFGRPFGTPLGAPGKS